MPEPLRRYLLLLAILLTGCAPMQGGMPSSVPPPSSTVIPTAVPPTPPPAVTLVPSPTPTPDPTLLDLEATSCEQGVVLEWSASTHPDFHHYTALRSPEREIKPDYPPIAPAVDWGDSYATDPFVTSAVDASIIPSDAEWNYRVMAYDAAGRVVAASPVRTARLLEAADVGQLAVDASGASTRLRWQPYDGAPACFSNYRVLYGTGGAPTSLLTVISAQDASSYETDALHTGGTYRLRVQAVRDTPLGSFVLGETEAVSYTVP